MDPIIRDVRHALRSFARTPAFAAVAVLTIGLGIGVNTAIFSVVNAVLLRRCRTKIPTASSWSRASW